MTAVWVDAPGLTGLWMRGTSKSVCVFMPAGVPPSRPARLVPVL